MTGVYRGQLATSPAEGPGPSSSGPHPVKRRLLRENHRSSCRAEVEWICGDALRTPFPAGSLALVSIQYPALPKAAGEVAVRALLGTVRPGGLLLAVYHDLDEEHREHMKSRGVDPADYIDVEDLARLLGDDFTVEVHAVEPRIDPPPDYPHIADVVLRAWRR